MTTYLPWIAFAAAAAALIAGERVRFVQAPRDRDRWPSYATFGALLLLFFLGLTLPQRFEGAGEASIGLGIGFLLAALSDFFGRAADPHGRASGVAGPIGLAVAAAGALLWLPEIGGLAAIFGAALAAWLLGLTVPEGSSWAGRATVALAAMVAANLLGFRAGVAEAGAAAGTLFGIVLVVGTILASFLGEKPGRQIAGLLAAGLIIVVGSWLVGSRLLQTNDAWVVFLGAGLVAAVVQWLFPDEAAAGTLRLALCAIIWVALATSAFAVLRGFGMSLAFLGAASVLLLLNNRRALLTLGPLGALVLYRVFRESHLEATRALDIGQHYAMIGILIGALLPVIAHEWLRASAATRQESAKVWLAAAVWGLVLVAAPVTSAMLLGARGVIGYVVGLGLAAVIEAVRGERSAHALALPLGLSAAMTLSYDWLAPFMELSRQEKQSAFIWWGSGLIIAAIVISVLSAEALRRAANVERPGEGPVEA